jgi:integrase
MSKTSPPPASAALVSCPAAPLGPAADLVEAAERARAFAGAARAPNTSKAYAARWRLFVAWCSAHGLAPLPAPPEAVALYLADLAARVKPSTLELTLTAIAQAHRLAGHPSPRQHRAVQEVRAGIRRTLGTRQEGKAPLLGAAVRQGSAELAAQQNHLLALRDRALILLGWFGALRRSELVAIDVGHARAVGQGLELLIPRSKTDQEGHGHVIPIGRDRDPDVCPVRALRAWLDAAGIREGAVFRRVDRWGHVGGRLSDHAVADVVKKAAVAAGVDPELIAGHSLRSGLVTEAARQGRAEGQIMKITRHESVTMLRRYIKEADRWREVASAGLL